MSGASSVGISSACPKLWRKPYNHVYCKIKHGVEVGKTDGEGDFPVFLVFVTIAILTRMSYLICKMLKEPRTRLASPQPATWAEC
jgi:hypothetical protein